MPIGAFCAFLSSFRLVRYFALFLGHADIHEDISYNPVNVGYELDFVGNNKTIRNLEIDNVDASNNAGDSAPLRFRA